MRDPRVVVTTARDPSSRLKAFSKEIKLLFPNAQRLNRGNHVLGELVEICRKWEMVSRECVSSHIRGTGANDVTDLVLLHETRGEPDAIVVCHLPHGASHQTRRKRSVLQLTLSIGPTASFSLSNVVMRYDIAANNSNLWPHHLLAKRR